MLLLLLLVMCGCMYVCDSTHKMKYNLVLTIVILVHYAKIPCINI